jgi:hypothetical protein
MLGVRADLPLSVITTARGGSFILPHRPMIALRVNDALNSAFNSMAMVAADLPMLRFSSIAIVTSVVHGEFLFGRFSRKARLPIDCGV